MRKLILQLLLLLVCTNSALAANTPDFAYPETVLADARARLDRSGGEGQDAVLAMLEITVATFSIDNDSVYQLPGEISALAEKQQSPALKSLLMIMQAQTLRRIYRNNAWQYDRTDTPDEPLPADISTWNGRQFRSQINKLALGAYDIACTEPLPLADFAGLIEADRVSLLYYPTVREFAALQALDMISFDSHNELSLTRNSLINKEIALTRPGSYSYINWQCRLLDNSSLEPSVLYDRVLRLYEKYSRYGAARQLLIKYLEQFSCYNSTTLAVSMCRRSLSDYPDYFDNAVLENRLAEMLRQWVKVEVPMTAVPGRECEIKVRYGNLHERAGIIIYQGKNNSTPDAANVPAADMTEVQRFNVSGRDQAPWQSSTVFRFTPEADVYYFVRTFMGDSISPRKSARTILASSLTPIVINGCTENAVIVARAADGYPVKGAMAKVGGEGRNPIRPVSVGKTDSEGMLRFKIPAAVKQQSPYNQYLTLEYKGADFVFGRNLGVNSYGYHKGEQLNALIMTERALYHPGDSIHWAAVLTRSDLGKRSPELLTHKEVTVRLLNANYEEAGKTTLRSDSRGRIEGAFATAAGQLTGSFVILVELNGNNIGSRSIEVSDFKLPQFQVSVEAAQRNVPAPGFVTINGRAATFSMMPVSGAAVKAEIKAASRFRFFMPDYTLGFVDSLTNAAGDFTIVVPDSMLSGVGSRCYMASIQVVAPSGESHSIDVPFTTGKPYEIVVQQTPVDCADTLSLPVKVYAPSGEQVYPALEWKLTADEIEVAAGSVSGSAYPVDWRAVPSGKYTLKVSTADTTLAVPSQGEISLYNTRLNTMDPNTPLFVPVASLDFPHGQAGELLYGVPEDTYIYMTLAADSVLVSTEGLESTAGFHRLRLTLPEGYENGVLSLYVVKKGKVYSRNVQISELVDRRLTIEGESFRDKVMPGNTERWRLKLTAPRGAKLSDAAMIATAYNKALSSIIGMQWPDAFNLPRSFTPVNARYYNLPWLSSSYDLLGKVQRQKVYGTPITADFIYQIPTYGRMIRIRGTGGMVEEAAMMKTAAYASAAPMNDMVTMMAEVAESEAAVEEDSGMENGSAEPAASDTTFTYRPSEVLQALWMPSLVADRQGNVDIEFVVPDANTTWSFNAFAWDEKLNSGSMMREIVARKPVMVQPNLPRFLRAGDTATVLATVYNNTEEDARITTVAEVYRLADGNILSSSSVDTAVKSQGSAIVSLPVEAPADASAIGYRVRSILGGFSDGEQAAIAVLPATTELHESEIFSMTAHTDSVSVVLPQGRDMQLALQYCSNPAWDVVKALPSLYEGNPTTSFGAVRRLFRAASSSGIIMSDPAIAAGLRGALQNPQDSSLVSQLAKNEELKLSTLQQTPWVQAAASQTERMARLGLLFDTRLVKTDIEESVNLLAKLQNSDGGFSWAQWQSNSSEWATAYILTTLGRINAMGFMPADSRLKAMIGPALKYLDNKTADRRTDITLALIYSMLPEYKPGLQAKQVIDNTVQQLIGDWRTASVGAKARIAMVLNYYGYANVAREIMASVSQFAQKQADGSVFFPSVDDVDSYAAVLTAYATVDPHADIIDGVRMWLAMRSQRTSALAACDPTELIAAFVRSGSRWIVAPEKPQIYLGEERLELPKASMLTGEFTMTIDNSRGARTLSIGRTAAQTPAVGAILSRYSGRTDSVGAADCSSVSIEKQISVLRDGVWQYARDIRLGERVKVLLSIHANDDLQYLTVTDDRAAGLEPVDQLPGYVASAGVMFYRENTNSATNLFIGWLPRGTYTVSYELTANVAGSFISGVASVQSQYNPSITAHSSGYRLTIR